MKLNLYLREIVRKDCSKLMKRELNKANKLITCLVASSHTTFIIINGSLNLVTPINILQFIYY